MDDNKICCLLNARSLTDEAGTCLFLINAHRRGAPILGPQMEVASPFQYWPDTGIHGTSKGLERIEFSSGGCYLFQNLPGILEHLLATVEHPVLSSPAFFCSCRNILSLTNEFDFPELSISRDEYPEVLMYLNATQADRLAQLPLKTCHLEDFLDKVPTETGHEGCH